MWQKTNTVLIGGLENQIENSKGYTEDNVYTEIRMTSLAFLPICLLA